MATTTKKELIDRIAERTGSKHTLVKTVVHYFLDEIITELRKGSRLEFRDFGVFETRMRAARAAQNPKTLTRVQVPAKRVAKFKPARLMKEKLDGQAPGDGPVLRPCRRSRMWGTMVTYARH